MNVDTVMSTYNLNPNNSNTFTVPLVDTIDACNELFWSNYIIIRTSRYLFYDLQILLR